MGHIITINFIPRTAPCNQERTSNSQLLYEKYRDWIPHLVTQFLRFLPKGWPPKHWVLKANRDCALETHKTIAKKQFSMGAWTPIVAIPLSLSIERTGKNAHFPDFPWQGFICIRYKLLLGSQISNISTLMDCLLSFPETREVGGHFPYLLPPAHSNNKNKSPVSPQKELVHMSDISASVAATWRAGSSISCL